MPKMMIDESQMLSLPAAGNFRFSAVRPETLDATEYTLATIVVDVTGSVASFKDELLGAVKAVVRACQKSPRAENLLVRLVTFNTSVDEVHGFKPLAEIDPDDYEPFSPSGLTALYDASVDALSATNRYAKLLSDQDYLVNAAVYIVTDGLNNFGRSKLGDVAAELKQAARDETLESLVTVLVGINTLERGVAQSLDELRAQAGLGQFVDVGEATPQRLAKLSAFVSRSISSQSQALGTGGPSQALSF